MSMSSASGLGMGPPTPLGETPPSIGSTASAVPPKVKAATFVCAHVWLSLILLEEVLGVWSSWSC